MTDWTSACPQEARKSLSRNTFFELRPDAMNAAGWAGDPRGKYAFVDSDICDAETGNALDYFGTSQTLTRIRAVVNGSRSLPDYLFCPYGQWLLLSLRALNFLQLWRCCESIRWIPTDIVAPNGTVLAEYRVGYGAREWDIWNCGTDQKIRASFDRLERAT